MITIPHFGNTTYNLTNWVINRPFILLRHTLKQLKFMSHRKGHAFINGFNK